MRSHALDALEAHFHERLLVDAGTIATVGAYAEQLRPKVADDGPAKEITLFPKTPPPLWNSTSTENL